MRRMHKEDACGMDASVQCCRQSTDQAEEDVHKEDVHKEDMHKGMHKEDA